MQDLHEGFRIGDRLVPWGTTMAEASRLLGLAAADPTHRVSFGCDHAYGFQTIEAVLTASEADRPITQVKFELACVVDGGGPGHWASGISQSLGEPDDVSESPLPGYGAPADCVTYYARWSLDTASMGLSIYGGPRQVDGGLSAGSLWISWSEELAARPYLHEWLARGARLEAIADRRTETRVFTLDWPDHPPYGYDGADPEAIGRCWSQLCLHRPEILATPPRIAALLNPYRFALWRSEQDGVWCASTPWESLALQQDGKPAIARHEVLPAKGGGYSMLCIDAWSVRSSCGSREILAAADFAARLAGVELAITESHDC